MKWKGYDSSQNTWEPVEHFSQAKEVLNEYEESIKPTSSIKKKVKKTIKKSLKDSFKGKKLAKTRSHAKKPEIESEEESSFEEEIDDVPSNILAIVNPKEKECEKRMFKINWQKRNNGVQPKNSILTSKEIKKKFGNEILLEFYEKNFKV